MVKGSRPWRCRYHSFVSRRHWEDLRLSCGNFSFLMKCNEFVQRIQKWGAEQYESSSKAEMAYILNGRKGVLKLTSSICSRYCGTWRPCNRTHGKMHILCSYSTRNLSKSSAQAIFFDSTTILHVWMVGWLPSSTTAVRAREHEQYNVLAVCRKLRPWWATSSAIAAARWRIIGLQIQF